MSYFKYVVKSSKIVTLTKISLFAKSNLIVVLEGKKIEAKFKDVYVHCFENFENIYKNFQNFPNINER